MNDYGLVLIRNSDFAFDARMKRQANAALRMGLSVTVLGWIRDDKQSAPEVIQLRYGAVRVIYFRRIAIFGDGFRNSVSIVMFNIWIFHQLVLLRNEYRILMACDLDVALPAFIVSKLLRKKVIFDIVDSYAQNHRMPMALKAAVARLEMGVIGLVDAVIVCNEVRHSLVQEAKPRKCIVLHNSPDMDCFRKSSLRICRSDSAKFRIAYIGTLTSHGRLLREIAQQAQQFSDVELHVGGFGPLEGYLSELAEKHSNIVFYGKLQNEHALQLQSECDLLFATYDPSIEINRYSAPLKLYEAMALGKPIVVCKGTTADELVLRLRIGLAIAYDADEFWRAVINLSRDRELCEAMGRRGTRAYEGEFNWEIMRDRLNTVFRDCLEPN